MDRSDVHMYSSNGYLPPVGDPSQAFSTEQLSPTAAGTGIVTCRSGKLIFCDLEHVFGPPPESLPGLSFLQLAHGSDRFVAFSGQYGSGIYDVLRRGNGFHVDIGRSLTDSRRLVEKAAMNGGMLNGKHALEGLVGTVGQLLVADPEALPPWKRIPDICKSRYYTVAEALPGAYRCTFISNNAFCSVQPPRKRSLSLP